MAVQQAQWNELQAGYEVTSANGVTTIAFVQISAVNMASNRIHVWVECEGTVIKDFGYLAPKSGSVVDNTRRTKSFSQGRSATTKTFTLNRGNDGTDGNPKFSFNQSYSFTVPAKPTYAVSYNANGGSGAPSGQSKWHGESLTLQSGTPTRTNYAFKNWNTKQDGSGSSYNPGGSYTTDSAVTLYAQWYSPYTVTYKSNYAEGGGDVSQMKVHGTGATVKGQETFTREGFRIKEWNTKADGTGTVYAIGATYSANADIALYAIWVPWVEPVAIGEITAIRTATNSDTVESDEGTYVYVQVPLTVKSGASGSYAITVTLTPDIEATGIGRTGGRSWTVPGSSGGDPQCVTNSYVDTFRFDSISTEASCNISVSVSATNSTYASQQAVTTSRTARLPTAYYTMDVLGDGWRYNKTSDTSVVSDKTYYTRTPEQPYEYTPVANPIPSGLGDYYEANGPRPGHGVSFGAPAKHEGFNIGMEQYYYDERVCPVCAKASEPYRTDVLWLDTGVGNAIKYHNGNSWVPLTVVCVQSSAPSFTNVIWIDTSNSSAPKLKFHNGSSWVQLPSIWG